jgi:hypothetical protein
VYHDALNGSRSRDGEHFRFFLTKPMTAAAATTTFVQISLFCRNDDGDDNDVDRG